jgi:hypothetical protein
MGVSPRSRLHTLIGQRERAEKRWTMGNPNAEKDYLQYKKEIEDLLREYPELESQVEIIEDYFLKQLYD